VRGRAFRAETDRIAWLRDAGRLQAWQQGRTGYPIIDAGMRQLAQTGWMHNRLRMIVASFLVKDLHLDWRLGERHFMAHLIDGDFAANNGGWQWAASTGTDAAPYFRIFNPTEQGKRFDPDGRFIRHYLPELAALDSKALHQPPSSARPADYPAPLVDHKLARLQTLEMFKAVKET
jgi:deoxyribodipyrimidine photo-lyase